MKRFVKGTLMAVKEAKANPDEAIQSLINWQASTEDEKEKKQARKVLDVTLSILYSPNNKDKRLGLNVPGGLGGALGHAPEIHGTQDRHEGRQISTPTISCRSPFDRRGSAGRPRAARPFHQ